MQTVPCVSCSVCIRPISPEDCYDVWFAGISPNYVAAVLDNVDIVRRDGYSEITYTWNHPARGLIWVRCGGVFFHNYPDGGFLIRGYHQDVTASIRSELRYQSLTAATSQIYYAIYTIDLKQDYMEQLSTANALFPLSDDKGVASEKIGSICKKYVREDYQPKLQDFFDLSTLQERLTHNRFVSREYRTRTVCGSALPSLSRNMRTAPIFLRSCM